MRNVNFYEITAQVLAALLIVLAIEHRTLEEARGRFHAANSAYVAASMGQREPWPVSGSGVAISAMLTWLLSLLGEVSALSILFFGTEGWLPKVAAPTCALALLANLLITALVLPLENSAVAENTRNLQLMARGYELKRQIGLP